MSSESDWDKSSEDEASPAPPPPRANKRGGRRRGRGNDDSDDESSSRQASRRDSRSQTPSRESKSESKQAQAQAQTRGPQRPFWTREEVAYEPRQFDLDPDFAQNESTHGRGERESYTEYLDRIGADVNVKEFSHEMIRFGVSIYETFSPIYENVADDNHRPFLVDLDSLVVDLLQNPTIDITHGVQSLPVIFLLESRLRLFCNGGRHVHITCFDVCKSMYSLPQYRLIRETVVAHLKRMTSEQRRQHEEYLQSRLDAPTDEVKEMESAVRPKNAYDLNIEFFEFENWWHEDFSDHIYSYLPVFTMVARPDYSKIVRPECRYLFVYLAIYLTAMEIPVVLSTEISYRSNAMYGFTLDVPRPVQSHVIRRFRKQLTTTSELERQMDEAANAEPEEVFVPRELNIGHSLAVYPLAVPPKNETDVGFEIPAVHFEKLDKLYEAKNFCDDVMWNKSENVDVRQLLTLFSCSEMLREEASDANLDFGRLMCLTLLFLKEVPMESRSFRLPVLAEELEHRNSQVASEDEVEEEAKEDAPESDMPEAEPEQINWEDMDDSDDDDFFNNVPEIASTPSTKTRTQESAGDNESVVSENAATVVRVVEATSSDASPVRAGNIKQRRIVLSRQPKSREVFRWESVVPQLAPFARFCRYLVVGVEWLQAKMAQGDFAFAAESCADLIDGRMICKLASQPPTLLSSEGAFGLFLPHQYEGLFNDLLGMAELPRSTSGLPVLQAANVRLNFEAEAEATTGADARDCALVQIRSPLIRVVDDVEESLTERHYIRGRKKMNIKEQDRFYRQTEWLAGQLVKDQMKPHPVPKTKREKKAAQNFTAFIQKYSQSLVGGKIVLREVIVSQKEEKESKAEEEAEVPRRKQKGGKGKKGKGKGKGKKNRAQKKVNNVREEAARAVQERAREEKKQKLQNRIQVLLTMESDIEHRIKHLESHLESDDDPVSAVPGLTTLHKWCLTAAQSAASENKFPGVRLWQLTFDIVRRFAEYLDIPVVQQLQTALHTLGFPRPAELLAHECVNRINTKIQADGDTNRSLIHVDDVLIRYTADDIRVTARKSYERFQLHDCGPFMLRNVDSRPDPRVDGFYPDSWQIDLLNIVDQRHSALVVAPTSSGKTFISYYCMKETLKKNKGSRFARDKRIVVYVCPKKALVQQTGADIYAKYGDVFGFYTEDYDHKLLECEVLVCVPATFEHLLMSPERQDIVNSIDYVIFDEVHELGRSEGGEIWERLLLMLRSPFLALSATVGHPEVFLDWLRRTSNVIDERNKSGKQPYDYQIHEITVKHRWSDLEKYMYLPETHIYQDDEFQRQNEQKEDRSHSKLVPQLTLEAIEGKQRATEDDEKERAISEMPDLVHVGSFDESYRTGCVKIHPGGAIAMGLGLDKQDEFPPGLAFSPHDSLILFDAMNRFVDELPRIYGENLRKLAPETYFREQFPDALAIDKKQCRFYERAIKEELTRWVRGVYDSQLDANETAIPPEDRKNLLTRVLSTLAATPIDRISRMEQAAANKGFQDCYSHEFVQNNITQLLMDCEKFDRLPCLAFALDRVHCEKLFLRVVHDLEKLEDDAKRWATRDEDLDAKRRHAEAKRMKQRKKLQKKLEQQARNKVDQDDVNVDEAATEDLLGAFDAETDGMFHGIDPRYTFIKRGDRMDEDDASYWIRRNSGKTGWTDSNPLIKALDRGVGLHHEGLPRTYRHLVETLFRARHLKVVFTTATLALGVNMPARTVIFAGDDPTLNPLNYRQMMGRAGRRGYDNVGHVIFMGIKPRKVSYLMTSALTSLNGHYPMTPTTALRCANLYAHYSDKRHASSVIANLIAHPPFSDRYVDPARLPLMQMQIKQSFRYSLEFMVHNGLLDLTAQAKGAGGVVAHLQQYEPDNFAFARVLESGLLHKLTEGFQATTFFQAENRFILQKLLLVICHIFVRTPLPSGYDPRLRNRRCGGKELRNKTVPGQSDAAIILPSLADSGDLVLREIDETLQQFNSDSKRMYQMFSRVFAPEDITAATTLPCSELSFADIGAKIRNKEPFPFSEDPSPTILSNLEEVRSKSIARSPFAALSGHGDDFESVYDIAETMRSDFSTQPEMIPMCEWRDLRGRHLNLNAFAYDFYVHGAYGRIVKENCLRDGQAWELLKEIQLLLSKLKECVNDVSNMRTLQEEEDERQRDLAQQQESEFTKVEKHKYSILRGKFYKNKKTGEYMDAKTFNKLHAKKSAVAGDSLCQALVVLNDSFKEAFRGIVPIGPVGPHLS